MDIQQTARRILGNLNTQFPDEKMDIDKLSVLLIEFLTAAQERFSHMSQPYQYAQNAVKTSLEGLILSLEDEWYGQEFLKSLKHGMERLCTELYQAVVTARDAVKPQPSIAVSTAANRSNLLINLDNLNFQEWFKQILRTQVQFPTNIEILLVDEGSDILTFEINTGGYLNPEIDEDNLRLLIHAVLRKLGETHNLAPMRVKKLKLRLVEAGSMFAITPNNKLFSMGYQFQDREQTSLASIFTPMRNRLMNVLMTKFDLRNFGAIDY